MTFRSGLAEIEVEPFGHATSTARPGSLGSTGAFPDPNAHPVWKRLEIAAGVFLAVGEPESGA
jgi:hypothetical protein